MRLHLGICGPPFVAQYHQFRMQGVSLNREKTATLGVKPQARGSCLYQGGYGTRQVFNLILRPRS